MTFEKAKHYIAYGAAYLIVVVILIIAGYSYRNLRAEQRTQEAAAARAQELYISSQTPSSGDTSINSIEHDLDTTDIDSLDQNL